jgi:hypothetical protein
MPSVLITDDNPEIESLKRSWVTPVYTNEDGLGGLSSLHEAGDALVALALMKDGVSTILGSGVMIGPGIAVVATHVLDEFRARNADPVLMTFLAEGTRAWLPRESSTVSGSSAFDEHRRVVSDVSLLSCTLNSDAFAEYPLMLAPIQISLPLIGERLWAFGYRHEGLDRDAALITPLVSSGLVSAVFPQGRGERMASPCIEVEMDTKGGMSGGPVVNANGDLVGIVSSSFDGGPSYVTLIWEALRLKFASRLPSLISFGDMSLFAARELGLVKLKGQVKRSKRGDVTMQLTESEGQLMAISVDSTLIVPPPEGSVLFGEQLEDFEDRWLDEIEEAVGVAAVEYLNKLDLSLTLRFLSAAGIPDACLPAIREVNSEDIEGVEDPDIQSVREKQDGTASLTMAFDLLTVCWTIEVGVADYLSQKSIYDSNFINVENDGVKVRMEALGRCHFEAHLSFDPTTAETTEVSIIFAGVVRRRPLRLLARKAS